MKTFTGLAALLSCFAASAPVFRDRRGVSAVEFALIAPVLVIGSFATIDAGMAVYEEMMITQALRSGAHLAITAQDAAQILNIVNAVASENFQVAQGTPSPGDLSTAITRYCVCPGVSTAQISCNSTCTGNVPPTQLFTISATKQFVGVLLPEMTLSGTIDVVAP